MNTDSDLEVGQFGIATRMVQPEPGQEPFRRAAAAATPGATMVYKPQPPTRAVSPDAPGARPGPEARRR